MNRQRRWVTETFVIGLGFTMASFFSAACLLGQRSTPRSSGLVSVAVLEKLVDKGRRCQTVTDDDVLTQLPRRHC
jgi:hypothetical protein